VNDKPDELLIADIAGDDPFCAEQSAETLLARYEDELLRALLDVVREPLIALDLCAEIAAAALYALRRLATRPAGVGSWLFELAEDVLRRAAEEEQVPLAARHELGLPPVTVTELDLAKVQKLGSPESAVRERLPHELLHAGERLRREAPARFRLARIQPSAHVVSRVVGDHVREGDQ
jgi:DNA-directed RNA polymerase specialized sigma24 family protein